MQLFTYANHDEIRLFKEKKTKMKKIKKMIVEKLIYIEKAA